MFVNFCRLLQLSVLLLLVIKTISTKDLMINTDFDEANKHVHRINTFAKKYLKDSNKNSLADDLGDFTGLNDVIARAEKLLASDLNADPRFDVEPLCLNHTKFFIESLIEKQYWALGMFDAMGKPCHAMLLGNTKWPGSYSDCVAAQGVVYYSPEPTVLFKGQYCRVSFHTTSAISPMVGMCFPNSCNYFDVVHLANTFLTLLPGVNPTNLREPTVTCIDENLEIDSKAKVVIVICFIFVAMMGAATTYDIVIMVFLTPTETQVKKKNKKSASKYGTYVSGKDTSQLADNTPLLQDGTESLTHETNVSQHKNDVRKVRPDDDKAIPTTEYILPKYEPGMLGKLLLSFSVYTNASKILSTSQPAGTLTSINGIRFVSMTWVVLGHTYGFGLEGKMSTNIYPKHWNDCLSQLSATLHGLLVAYLSLKEMKKVGSALKFKWGLYYFHRFWRLTPPYMLWLMVYVTTMKYWYTGPFWSQTGLDVNDCQDTWWKNILYINNIVKPNEQCMGWSWYLANDMQFYVLSPLLLIPLFYSPLLGSLMSLAFILTNFIAAGLISKHYGLQSNSILSQEGFYMEKYYITPWTRIAPYVVGFYTGYLLYKTECKFKMTWLMNAAGWTTATAFALLSLYGTYSSDMLPTMSTDVAAFYNATSRTAWGMAVAWVIFACATGYGGPVNVLLSWKGIIPLSRLTYCAYLVQTNVIDTYFMSKHTMMYWHDYELVYIFLGNLCVTFAVAFVVSLAFESPMMGLEKVLLGRAKNR